MGSGLQENYSLKWQNFHQSLASSFKELRSDDEFLDVTIACDEEQQVQAHKVIISACSPYFKSMLGKHRGPGTPVLIMPDSVRFRRFSPSWTSCTRERSPSPARTTPASWPQVETGD